MSVLIIDSLASNDGRRKYSRDAIGVGPRLLSGVFEKYNLKTQIARVEDLLEKGVSNLISQNEIFLISGMTVDLIAVKRVIRKIRQNNNKSQIILGGPILSDEELINSLEIDIGIIGEGERILADLIENSFSIDNFREKKSNQYYCIKFVKDKVLFKGIMCHTHSLFEEFSPSTEIIQNYPDYWFSKVYVEVVRGCSNHLRGDIVKINGGCNNCSLCDTLEVFSEEKCPEVIPPGCGFCSVPATFGPARSRNVQQIVKECNELLSKGVRRIILSAPGFLDYSRGKNNEPLFSPTYPTPNLEKIEELLSKLSEIRDQQKHICSISIENVKPSLVNPEVARIIGKYLPNTSISIGCETFDEDHSNKIGRPSKPSKALEAAKLFSENKISPHIYLIHSLPGETVNSVEITKRTIEENMLDFVEKITVYRYLPLPNSPFSVTDSPSPVGRHLLKIKREELKKTIIQFNLNKKKSLINAELTTIVAEKDKKREDTYICYPIFSGPAISVYSPSNIIKKVLTVKISAVISDKLVEGVIINEGESSLY